MASSHFLEESILSAVEQRSLVIFTELRIHPSVFLILGEEGALEHSRDWGGGRRDNSRGLSGHMGGEAGGTRRR